MIERPLKAAKPATTSAMDALSHVTVMRGSSPGAAALYEAVVTSGERAGRAEAGRDAGAENSPGAALDQARKGRSAPNEIRISLAFWSMV